MGLLEKASGVRSRRFLKCRDRKMFRQQSITDPPAEEDVFRFPTFSIHGPVSALV